MICSNVGRFSQPARNAHGWCRQLQTRLLAGVSVGMAQRFNGFVPRCAYPQGGVGVYGNGLLLFRVADNFGKNESCWSYAK